MMEIGSIFELNPDLLRERPVQAAGSFRPKETEKYGKKNIRFTASGREAIALALKSFEQEHPEACKRCLLPAYMCDSVFFPFERAGWELHFYHLDRKLEADVDELQKLIEQIRPALLFVHPYYGVDTWKSSRSFFCEWRKRGICIMEDVTQSYYLENAGKDADYCVGSLRKWYAVPDGGFVASDEKLQEAELASNEEFTRKKGEALREKWEYLHGQMEPAARCALKSYFLRKNRETEIWLDSYDGISAMSEETERILSQTDEKACADRRRENCVYLHKNIGGRAQVVPVFGHCDAVPLYYPVYAADRDDMQKFLALRGVYAPTLWPVGEENAAVLTQDEQYIYEHILALPIDQRYGITEMRRVLELLDQYEVEKMKSERALEIDAVPESAEKMRQSGQVIGIRVDANETIATGHVMRCITIARKLVQAGSEVIFYTADEYAGGMLGQAGMQYICLHTKWDDMELEIPVLREKLMQAGCGKLLVDSYQVTVQYFEGLRDLCKLIYIDDCFEEIYPVDMIINYNAYHVRFPYESTYVNKARLLLGTSYVPLREEFGERGDGSTDAELCRGADSGATSHILLSSGGGDLHNAMAGILRVAMQEEMLQGAIFHVVVGGFNCNADKLRQLAAEHPNIRLHEQVDHMAQLMRICTAAVSAAGTMLFELSAMQVPTVFFVSADNQQYDHEFFAQDGRMLYAGDIRADRDGCLENICGQLRQLLQDGDMRAAMKRKLHAVTDGNGAQRIAAEILRL